MATNITRITSTVNSLIEASINDNNSTGEQLNNYGIYLTAFKKAFNSNETLTTVTPDSPSSTGSSYTESSTSSDNTWKYTLTSDGWYKLVYLAVPFWNVGTLYNVNSLAYDEVTDLFYIALSSTMGGNTPSSNSNFQLVTDPITLFNNIGTGSESDNLIYQEFNIINTQNTSKLFGDLTAVAAIECCSNCKRPQEVEVYEFTKLLLDGMAIADNRSEYIKGEKIARRAEQLL